MCNKSVNPAILVNIYKIRQFFTTPAVKKLVHATIINKIDYCNALLYGIPNYLLKKLTTVLHASARIIFCISKTVDVHPFLKKLYWLPIEERIIFSLLTNKYKALNKLSPDYIRCMPHYHQATRTLRSKNYKKLQQPRWNLNTLIS